MDWVKQAYPLGPRSLYGGMDGYILVSLDDITPGLVFNSQPANTYAKWIFTHEDKVLWHKHGSDVAKKIEDFIAQYPIIGKCIPNAEDANVEQGEKPLSYAWFNAYCLPGYGEKFKKNEQVSRVGNNPFHSYITLYLILSLAQCRCTFHII
jgi:hypothetical protein